MHTLHKIVLTALTMGALNSAAAQPPREELIASPGLAQARDISSIVLSGGSLLYFLMNPQAHALSDELEKPLENSYLWHASTENLLTHSAGGGWRGAAHAFSWGLVNEALESHFIRGDALSPGDLIANGVGVLSGILDIDISTTVYSGNAERAGISGAINNNPKTTTTLSRDTRFGTFLTGFSLNPSGSSVTPGISILDPFSSTNQVSLAGSVLEGIANPMLEEGVTRAYYLAYQKNF